MSEHLDVARCDFKKSIDKMNEPIAGIEKMETALKSLPRVATQPRIDLESKSFSVESTS